MNNYCGFIEVYHYYNGKIIYTPILNNTQLKMQCMKNTLQNTYTIAVFKIKLK